MVLPRGDAIAAMQPPPGPDSQAGRDWRSDWARLRKMQAAGGAGATAAAPVTANATNGR